MARMGEIIDGKYEILREVGRGGMSVVYLAMDKRLNKQWAIKEFRKDKDDSSKQVALKALLDEANLMKKLDHPTLPRIVDIIDDHRNVYVIMDYIEGESLNKVLDAYGAQPQEAVIEWAKQLSEVLDYLHTQSPPVIYRDMKPANIMLKPDGTVRLIDFGIAREYKEGKDGDTEAIGTRGYAAPEQFGGKGQTDARTDIYSLGVTLYHLVTGKNPAEPPYEIYPIRHWNPSLSSGLEWLIQKCTQLNPNDRYQSCAEVTYVLDNLDKFESEYKKKQKSRISLFMIFAILTVVFAIGSVGSFLGSASAKQNSYDNLIEGKSYISAMSVDDKNPLAYTKLAEQLRSEVQEVKKDGNSTGTSTPSAIVTTGDIYTWFPSDKMREYFESEHPENYAKINFELGLLMWDKYNGGNDEDMREAMGYFEKVLSVAQKGTAGNTAGLSEKEFNWVKVYYCASFFQNNKTNLSVNIVGEKKELTEIEKFAGIDVETYDRSPYAAFWNTNEDILDILSSNIEMEDKAKLDTLDKLAYILDENYAEFYEAGISKDTMINFLNCFEEALNSIPSTVSHKSVTVKGVKDKVNIIIPSIEALYGTEMEEIK